MLKRTLSQKKNRSYEEIHHSCTVRFLDDSEPLSATFEKETKGQWLIDDVCKKLDIEEKDYFGLRFVDSDKQRHWLDPLKSIHKQLKHVLPVVLCFRVKFYPTEPTKLKEEITRYHLFLQLRRDLHHGRLLCSPQDANLLAAYIIQSEVGDYDPDDHQPGYVSKFKMLPKQTNKQEEKIAELHKTLLGETPADVEISFLKKASSLDTYGVDPHPVKDQKGNQMYLGVTHLGIVTFQGNKRTHLFKWSQITKIAFEGKMFIVHVTISEDSENSLIVKKKKHACGFKCPTFSACKHLWKCAVEQQYFFTLDAATEAPRVTAGGGWFSRGARFRFSGRCQREVYTESAKINREEPMFERCVSNPSLVKSYNKRRSESLPSKLKDIALNQTVNMDESTQSLVAGELSIDDTPNGSVVKATDEPIQQGLPPQTPVQVSDRPYEPMRSPSREDLPAAVIATIPEDSVLLTSDMAEPDEDSFRDRETEGVTDGEVKDDMLPRYSEIMETVPSDTIPVDIALDTDQEQTTPMTVATDSDALPGNHVQPSNEQPEVTPEQNSAMLERGLRCCRVLTLAFLFVFTVLFFVVLFALESEMDMPVIRYLRGMPELQDFKVTHYDPFKTTVAERMGKLFK